MHDYHQHLVRVAVFAALVGAVLLATRGLAQDDASILVDQPADSPVLPPPQRNAAPETIPAPSITEEAFHPTPPIVYRASRSARRMFRCGDTVDVVMVTRNPADCCLYEIPLCLPACCVGEPKVDERRGLLGRGVVEYCWDCGFRATVKFRRLLGDVKVSYDG